MRPKIVILTLVGAFVLLGVIALLKGVTGKNGGDVHETVPVEPATTTTTANAANTNEAIVSGSGSNQPVVVSDQLRAAVIEKEVGQVRDILAQADGTNNSVVIAALVDKLSHSESEVRLAALDALKQLNDTNAVPGLEKAAEAAKDPHEKVAMLDAIDYIKMPSITDNAPPEMATNGSYAQNPPIVRDRAAETNVQYNPNFIKAIGKTGKQVRTVGPPNAPAPQPQ